MAILERPPSGTYDKGMYRKGAILAHFAVQLSPYAQRMLRAAQEKGASMARVEYANGNTLQDMTGSWFVRLNRKRILRHLANAVVDHLRFGVEHGDVAPRNIVVSGGLLHPLKISIIDYADALQINNQNFDRILLHRREIGGINDFAGVNKNIIPALADRENERNELREYFKREFFKRIDRAFGEKM